MFIGWISPVLLDPIGWIATSFVFWMFIYLSVGLSIDYLEISVFSFLVYKVGIELASIDL